jgi:hypothetical protein
MVPPGGWRSNSTRHIGRALDPKDLPHAAEMLLKYQHEQQIANQEADSLAHQVLATLQSTGRALILSSPRLPYSRPVPPSEHRSHYVFDDKKAKEGTATDTRYYPFQCSYRLKRQWNRPDTWRLFAW